MNSKDVYLLPFALATNSYSGMLNKQRNESLFVQVIYLYLIIMWWQQNTKTGVLKAIMIISAGLFPLFAIWVDTTVCTLWCKKTLIFMFLCVCLPSAGPPALWDKPPRSPGCLSGPPASSPTSPPGCLAFKIADIRQHVVTHKSQTQNLHHDMTFRNDNKHYFMAHDVYLIFLSVVFICVSAGFVYSQEGGP